MGFEAKTFLSDVGLKGYFIPFGFNVHLNAVQQIRNTWRCLPGAKLHHGFFIHVQAVQGVLTSGHVLLSSDRAHDDAGPAARNRFRPGDADHQFDVLAVVGHPSQELLPRHELPKDLRGVLQLLDQRFDVVEQCLLVDILDALGGHLVTAQVLQDVFEIGAWPVDEEPPFGVSPEFGLAGEHLRQLGARVFLQGAQRCQVRIAAVEALCMLAQSSPSFAEKCLDFLVDMFNDEIEEVRLQSIHTMRKISNNITLREDQLDTVLAVLEDSSRDIREALHELLCCTNVSTKEGIHLALVELLKNLTKYPTDRESIWKCLKFLGSRHPTLVLPLVPELLSTHPFFDTPEPDMDDPAYIAVLVLIFNAAKSCPTMPALFSDHTFRHYAYLRDSLSHLVPPLRLPGRKLLSSPVSPSVTPHEDPSQQFLHQSLERVYNLQHLDPQGIQELLEFTIRDLQRLGELQSELAGMADFTATYLQCQLLLIKALQEKLWNVAAPLYLKQNALASAAAKQILEETYKMEFMYSGVESRQVVIIHHMRLQAKALQLIVTARTTRGVEPLFGMCEKFLQEVDSFQRCFISELPHMQGSFVDKLLDLMPRLVTSKPSEVVKILQTTLRQSTFLHLPLPEQLHRATANIIEPTGESDNPLRFTSGLVVALDVDATLEHVQDPQGTVKVQVLYPDGQAQIIHPKPADFRNPGPGRHRLITQVYLSHTAWTEPCQIEVRLLLAYNSNRSKASSKIPKSGWSESLEAFPQSDNGIEGTIPFSKPVKVYIMPKPARR
uniref:Integrator complex subunit 4 n=1 Tax=Calidris pygmaea TaxID=425635 RepID=A0A8C3PNM9_9CHAR